MLHTQKVIVQISTKCFKLHALGFVVRSSDPDQHCLFQILTLVKTCEPVADMRICRLPRDWSLLALQNIRTGKSHYLVICRCPETSVLGTPDFLFFYSKLAPLNYSVYCAVCTLLLKKTENYPFLDIKATLGLTFHKLNVKWLSPFCLLVLNQNYNKGIIRKVI